MVALSLSLHWDVNHPDPISFRQSTFVCSVLFSTSRCRASTDTYSLQIQLIVSYHNLRVRSFFSPTRRLSAESCSQAMIHRPYLPSPEHPISLSNKAFATCVDAANFGSAALHLAFQREKVLALNAEMSNVRPHFEGIVFVCAPSDSFQLAPSGLCYDPARGHVGRS